MKYKIGDWVKVVRLSPKQKGCDHKVGFVGKIESVNDRKSSFLCSLTDCHDVWDWDDIVPCCQHGKVEGETCVDCKTVGETKFKVGDRVKTDLGYGYVRGVRDDGTGFCVEHDKDIGEGHDGMGFGYNVKVSLGKRGRFYGTSSDDVLLVQKIDEPMKIKIETYDELRKFDMAMYETWSQLMGIKPRKESFMQKLSNLPQAIRRAFNKDQKALYRAGYIDQHGEWTDKAHNEAREDFLKKYLNDNKAEFVERANEAIELAKEEKEECD